MLISRFPCLYCGLRKSTISDRLKSRHMTATTIHGHEH
nr:MAG TPA: SARCOSINE OXIDASE ALPHA SUBUNIT, SARCOSINE Oxidase, Ligand Complex, Oxidoreductase [Caudoviricetes sp.]